MCRRRAKAWTTLDIAAARYMNAWRELEPISSRSRQSPTFGIGQRAKLLRTPHGNILWDCIALIDHATVEMIKAMGGIKGIAISHPHYYTTHGGMEPARSAACRSICTRPTQWIMRSDRTVKLWRAQTKELLPGADADLLRRPLSRRHLLHWAQGAGGKGALLSGDIVQVVQDNKSVSFMWSFPNFIPLSAPRVKA